MSKCCRHVANQSLHSLRLLLDMRVWLDRVFYFSTGRRSRKSRNLSINPNCTVCPENASEAVILDSTAREIGEKSLLSRFAAVYKRKYDWDMSDSKEPIYEVRPHPVSWPARDSSRPPGGRKIHGYWFQNVIQLTVSNAVSGSMFQKRFQELVSRGVSEFQSNSRSNQLVQKPYFRTHLNRMILKPSCAFTS